MYCMYGKMNNETINQAENKFKSLSKPSELSVKEDPDHQTDREEVLKPLSLLHQH